MLVTKFQPNRRGLGVGVDSEHNLDDQCVHIFLTLSQQLKSSGPKYFCISYDYKMQNVKIEKPNDFYKLWLETTGKMFADVL